MVVNRSGAAGAVSTTVAVGGTVVAVAGTLVLVAVGSMLTSGVLVVVLKVYRK